MNKKAKFFPLSLHVGISSSLVWINRYTKNEFIYLFKNSERMNHANFWEKNVPGRENSSCKGLAAGIHLSYFRNRKDAV